MDYWTEGGDNKKLNFGTAAYGRSCAAGTTSPYKKLCEKDSGTKTDPFKNGFGYDNPDSVKIKVCFLQ